MAELKPGWQRVKFGELANCINDRVDDPSTAGVERYVGLEHLDPESLTIRRWGSPEDVESTKLRFKPGDIIFGKRRAYQRKLVVADFEGICSAHAMVLRAKPAVVLPEFLAFFMQSDLFMERAVEISVGSLSPTINWKTLAKQEFALPPFEEQRRIAGIKVSGQLLSKALLAVRDRLDTVVVASSREVFARPLGLELDDPDIKKAKPQQGWSISTAEAMLKDGILVALQDGNHGSQYPRADELGASGYPYISASDISDDGLIDLNSVRRIAPERAGKLRIPPALSGDVVLSHNATVGRVTRLPEWETPIVASTSTTYYRCAEGRLDPEYLRWFLESELFQRQLRTVMRQSTRNQVPITMQKRLLLAWPPLQEQCQIAALGTELRQLRIRLDDRRNEVVKIQQLL